MRLLDLGARGSGSVPSSFWFKGSSSVDHPLPNFPLKPDPIELLAEGSFIGGLFDDYVPNQTIMFRITRTHLQSLQSGVGLACHAITGEGPRNRWTKRLARASLTKGASVLVVGLDSPCRILRAGIPVPSSLDARIHQRQTLLPLTKSNQSQPDCQQNHTKRTQAVFKSVENCKITTS